MGTIYCPADTLLSITAYWKLIYPAFVAHLLCRPLLLNVRPASDRTYLLRADGIAECLWPGVSLLPCTPLGTFVVFVVFFHTSEFLLSWALRRSDFSRRGGVPSCWRFPSSTTAGWLMISGCLHFGLTFCESCSVVAELAL